MPPAADGDLVVWAQPSADGGTRIVGLRLGGGAPFPIATVSSGEVRSVLVSGKTVAWHVDGRLAGRHLHADGEAPLMARWSARRSPRLGPFSQLVLLCVLVELWILNVADLLLTRYSLWLGFAKESNGVMDYFFRSGTVPARSPSRSAS